MNGDKVFLRILIFITTKNTIMISLKKLVFGINPTKKVSNRSKRQNEKMMFLLLMFLCEICCIGVSGHLPSTQFKVRTCFLISSSMIVFVRLAKRILNIPVWLRICWNRTSSQPYWKIMISIVSQTILTNIKLKIEFLL